MYCVYVCIWNVCLLTKYVNVTQSQFVYKIIVVLSLVQSRVTVTMQTFLFIKEQYVILSIHFKLRLMLLNVHETRRFVIITCVIAP